MATFLPALFQSFYKDRLVKINLTISLVLNILLWLGLIWQVRYFGESVALHYDIYFGINLLGDWYQLFLMPGCGLAFILLNFFIASAVYSREKILTYFLVVATSFIQLIFILAAIAIVAINL